MRIAAASSPSLVPRFDRASGRSHPSQDLRWRKPKDPSHRRPLSSRHPEREPPRGGQGPHPLAPGPEPEVHLTGTEVASAFVGGRLARPEPPTDAATGPHVSKSVPAAFPGLPSPLSPPGHRRPPLFAGVQISARGAWVATLELSPRGLRIKLPRRDGFDRSGLVRRLRGASGPECLLVSGFRRVVRLEWLG